MKLTVMTSSAEEERTADALGGGDDDFDALGDRRVAAVFLAEMLQRLVRVLDHDDGRIHHRADGDGDAAERHDVRRQTQPHIGRNERMIAMGSVMMATSAERTCQRKTMQTSATTMLSSISFSRSVAIELLISWLRS